MEVPEAQFVATIERWNEMAAAGKDEDFNFPWRDDDDHRHAALLRYEGVRRRSVHGRRLAGGTPSAACSTRIASPSTACSPSASRPGGMFFNTYPQNLNCLSHTPKLSLWATPSARCWATRRNRIVSSRVPSREGSATNSGSLRRFLSALAERADAKPGL